MTAAGWFNTRMRRLLLIALLCVSALALTPATPSAAVSPINPDNRPRPLPGVENGVVPIWMLTRLTPTCIAAREAAPSLHRLFTMARQARFVLDAEECYRPLDLQVRYADRAAQPGANPACVASISRRPDGRPIGNSMHGWGKAADLVDNAGSLTFGSHGYAFMLRFGNGVGWNHPAFARPGGSSCPEPWHWEFVGDGGRMNLSPLRGDVVGLLPSPGDGGYATVTGLGALGTHGNFTNRGSTARIPIAWVVVGAIPTPDRRGYWMYAADGGVFSFGNAKFYGSLGGRHLNAPVNGMARTPNGRGYWLLAWDGGVFTFGNAKFHGSTGNRRLNAPVVGMAVVRGGGG
jgi:hypothetical protein